MTDIIFNFLSDKNLTALEQFLNNIDPILILELPNLVDTNDNGKSLIHKCAQIKSSLLLETLVETYRRVYV